MTLLKIKNILRFYKRKFKLLLLPENRKTLLYVIGILVSLSLIAIISVAAKLNQQPVTAISINKTEDVPVSDPTVVTFSTKEPSEEVPVESPYQVADDEPRLITMPTANINGFVQKVGVDQDNKIAVPSNINMVGWYINSVKPGEQGLSIIDGHVDGRYTGGIFYNLKDISIGDEYTITYGDGTTDTFKVVDKVQVSEADSANVLFAKRPEISSQLNLITCIGTYLADQESYDQRLVVVSEKI